MYYLPIIVINAIILAMMAHIVWRVAAELRAEEPEAAPRS